MMKKPGHSGQKFGKLTMPCSIKISKPPLKELDEGQEALELMSDEDWVNKLPKKFTYKLKMVQ